MHAHGQTPDPAGFTRLPQDGEGLGVAPVVPQRKGQIGQAEMYRVFNMGIGFCAVVSRFFADAILGKIRRTGFQGHLIGEIVKGERGVEIAGVELDGKAKADL